MCGWEPPVKEAIPRIRFRKQAGRNARRRQTAGTNMDDTRLDKWLWSVRVFKTRPEATATCRNERVEVNGLLAKPGRDVHVGETVIVRIGMVTRTLKVVGLPRSRVSAKQLADYVTDLTPPEEYERAKQARLEHMLARARGKGRPTKKDRREMGELFGFE